MEVDNSLIFTTLYSLTYNGIVFIKRLAFVSKPEFTQELNVQAHLFCLCYASADVIILQLDNDMNTDPWMYKIMHNASVGEGMPALVDARTYIVKVFFLHAL